MSGIFDGRNRYALPCHHVTVQLPDESSEMIKQRENQQSHREVTGQIVPEKDCQN